MEDDALLDLTFSEFIDADWPSLLPPFDVSQACLRLGWAGMIWQCLSLRAAGGQVCVPLQPSYSMRCCVLSREGALRALRRLRVINDSADVMLFRHPPPSMRFLDVRPTPVTLTDAGTTQRERWREAPAAPWRPALSWLPRQLALMERIIRRYIAFLRAVGPRGFFRVRVIPLNQDSQSCMKTEPVPPS